jgi:hypothetical protein
MTKEWKLPKPERLDGEYHYFPVVRAGRTIPFGYEVDPEDDKLLQPITRELDLLEQAKKHLKQYSLRAVADWLSHESGRSISHVGLRARIKIEQRRKTEAAHARYFAHKYKEALAKAEKLESQRIGGSRTRTKEIPSDSDPSTD